LRPAEGTGLQFLAALEILVALGILGSLGILGILGSLEIPADLVDREVLVGLVDLEDFVGKEIELLSRARSYSRRRA